MGERANGGRMDTRTKQRYGGTRWGMVNNRAKESAEETVMTMDELSEKWQQRVREELDPEEQVHWMGGPDPAHQPRAPPAPGWLRRPDPHSRARHPLRGLGGRQQLGRLCLARGRPVRPRRCARGGTDHPAASAAGRAAAGLIDRLLGLL